jgi:hypothetical protein
MHTTRDGETFKASDWLSQNDVKPAIAQRIADYYKPLYSEAYDAFLGKDVQLREGYSHYKKTKLKAYVEFLKSIVSAAETRATVMKTVRKPRKKKEKPVSVIVGKLKYKEKMMSMQSYPLTSEASYGEQSTLGLQYQISNSCCLQCYGSCWAWGQGQHTDRI